MRGRAPQYGKHRTRTAAARDFARQLRKDSTDAEKRLWLLLRDHRFNDFQFRRQYACGIYFLDFYCTVARLAVELDGGGHGFPDQRAKDRMRIETAFSPNKASMCCVSGIINCGANLMPFGLKCGTL
jgi:very-short-patch-repair endonuclease